MLSVNFIGQTVGFIAMLVSVAIYWQRKRKNIIFMKLTTDVLWALHHLLIFSYTAAATATAAIFREFVFYNYDKKWAKSRMWQISFSLLFAVAAVVTWKDCFSIIPAISSILTTIAFGNKRIFIIKLFAFAASVGMMIYGIHYHSAATIVNECLTQSSIIAAAGIGCINKRRNKNESN